MNIAKSFVRVGAVIRKELREIARRPGALLSLTLGPLAVLALFGIGYTGNRAPVDVAVVIPRGVELPREVATYDKIAEGSGARVVTVTDDVAVARARLARGEGRLLIAVPADIRDRLARGEQATLVSEANELDP